MRKHERRLDERAFDAANLQATRRIAGAFVVIPAHQHHLDGSMVLPPLGDYAQRLAADTVATERSWVAMTKDTSLDGVSSDAKAAEKTGGQFDSDVQALTTSLNDDLTPLVNQSFALYSAATALNRQGAALRQRASVLNVLVSVLTAAPGS